MIEPYWQDDWITLYNGKLEDVIPDLYSNGFVADVAVADPPYADTSFEWDRWPFGWPGLVATVTRSMWCFGSARMFDTDEYRADLRIGGWRLSHDVIWEKNAPTANLQHDRFSRIHEHIRHFYHGAWGDVYHVPERVTAERSRPGMTFRRAAVAPGVHGERGASTFESDGKAIAASVLHFPNVRGGIHATQKPVPLLEKLIRYGAPPGGMVLSPFGGSGADGVAARNIGRRAVIIESREPQCEVTAQWLAESVPLLALPEDVIRSEEIRRADAGLW